MQLTTTRQGFAPATITEAMEFSKMLAESSMVPRAYQGKPQDIMVCVQWGYELGLAPMQALQNIAVINGKPSVYGDAMMALVQASPICEGIDEYIENEGTANPVAVCVAKRKGRNPVIARFSVDDAKRAGLWGKQGPWQAYPKRMLQMRARGFALRDAFPDVLKGLITAEEAQDYPQDELSRNSPVNSIQPKPANPLDVICPVPPMPSLPKVTSDPVVIQQAMEDTVEEVVLPGTEVVDIPEIVASETSTVVEEQLSEREPGQDDEEVVVGYQLKVPGKDQPVSVHSTLDEWQDAYEDMADKIARAGKRPPRERMTILREFREANEETIKRVDSLKRIRHTANYSKRLAALGAAQ